MPSNEVSRTEVSRTELSRRGSDREVQALKVQIAQLQQALAAAQEDKSDLELLLETITEHSTTMEFELDTVQSELRRALEQEQALNQRIEQLATLEERNRIARDIHDSLGHLLVALNIQMEAALELWQEDPERAHAFLVKAKQQGSRALDATRQSVANLRCDALAEQSLAAAIASLTDEFQRTTGIPPNCQIHLPQPLAQSVNTVLYRIVQEGLTNICKHAHATAVSLQIHATASNVALSLQDNGNGFQPDAQPSGFGLQGMRERVTALGGTLDITSAPTAGCGIRASIPIATGTNTLPHASKMRGNGN